MAGKKLRIIRDGKIDRMFLDGVEIDGKYLAKSTLTMDYGSCYVLNLEYHIKEVDIEGIEVTEQTNKG
ncbi:hypothetical protein [Carnobacterium maltaromaticum]|uniref:hypothetical protein n=1 Tax=Carnobacterium maltaromaticum TaxID=2751 RepID=UPI00054E4687|nr:hypothetical protein [Carnobacterium maltaromaticum]KRN61628.1 hypothetical protein IV70_GL000378 [Carnobacterium maltaromaticum DSM 20342]